ncbi:hypothetical protein NDU88_002555 [Pleurodeles waltl]|uniref:Uncharacterized protein n=1 Tax=Pleurodeles waltl TaxID=8319 RepID=A0AAV7SCS6_PLEWA|nr:hypothetical protein NDU88_002555 [Pleurodeles waltl]
MAPAQLENSEKCTEEYMAPAQLEKGEARVLEYKAPAQSENIEQSTAEYIARAQIENSDNNREQTAQANQGLHGIRIAKKKISLNGSKAVNYKLLDINHKRLLQETTK